jgi:hypothetical protein
MPMGEMAKYLTYLGSCAVKRRAARRSITIAPSILSKIYLFMPNSMYKRIRSRD